MMRDSRNHQQYQHHQQQHQSQRRQQLSQRAAASEALMTFARQTSAHGARRLTHGDTIQRTAWCCFVILGCSGICLHLTLLVHRYLVYPVSTEFLTDEVDLRFPSVTVCPMRFSSEISPTTESNNAVKGQPRGLADLMHDVARLYLQLGLPPDWNASVPEQAFTAYEDAKLALNALAVRRSMVFQEPHEIVIYCRYNSADCNYRNFSVHMDQERFLCMTFNPINRTVVQPGEGHGLFLLLHHNATSILANEEQIDSSAGFKVVVHEPGEMPDFSQAFNSPLGYKTLAQLSSTMDYSINRATSPCLEQLPNATYTWDYSRLGDYENVTFFGTLQDCVIRAKQEEFVRECRCLADHMAIPADLLARWPPCCQLPEEFLFRDIHYNTSNDSRVYYTITDNNGSYYPLVQYLEDNSAIYEPVRRRHECYSTVRVRQSTVGLTSGCRSPCVTRLHSVITTLASWPSVHSNMVATEVAVGSCLEQLQKLAGSENRSLSRLQLLRSQLPERLTHLHFAVIDLYPRSISATMSREDWAYPLRNLFSDLGGILGLWVGISIITLIEVIELGLQLAYLTFKGHSGKSNQIRSLGDCKAVAGDAAKSANEPRDLYSTPAANATSYQLHCALPSLQEGDIIAGGEVEVVKHNKSWFQRIFSL